MGQGPLRRPRHHVRLDDLRVRGALPRLSYSTKQPVTEELKQPAPRDHLASPSARPSSTSCSACRSASPPPEDAAPSPTRPWSAGFLVPQLDPLLPVGAADLALLHVLWEAPFVSDVGYFSPISEGPRRSGSAACCWPGWCSASTAAPSTPVLTRGAMVESLSEDYITDGQGQGPATARRWSTDTRLRAALVPVVTIFGIDFGVPARRARSSPSASSTSRASATGACERSTTRTCRSWQARVVVRGRLLIVQQHHRRHRLQLPRPESEAS